MARFNREMKIIAKLDHANIVRATDAGEELGFHYLVMDLVEGHDLSSVVKRLGPLSVADACALVRLAACALEYIHQHGLVHRDIKPSNLMVDRSGQLKLLDLGSESVSGRAADGPEPDDERGVDGDVQRHLAGAMQ